MSVKLISDSASDMTQREAKELGVIILPLRTVIDGVEYLDGVTITTEEFYEKLESCKTLPTTRQIPPSDFEDTLRPIVEAGDEAVIVTLAGKLSGTAQNAAIAAAEVGGRIWLVDSGNVAIGENILLRYAIRLRDQGLAGCEIAEELERVKCRICLLARVDTLEYLVLGGRLPKTAGAAGTLLNTKPVLSVEDGDIHVLGRARNPWQCDIMMNRFIKKKGKIDFSMPVMLAYDAHLKNYINSSRVLREGHLNELPVTIIGSSVSVHAGPGAIAMAFFSKEKMKSILKKATGLTDFYLSKEVIIMSVKLISDSASDMTQQEAKEQGVIILPLRTMIDGVEYLDGVTITTEEFYEKLENCKTLPTTSQIPPSDFEDALHPIVEAGDEAVIIALAGKLSGTAQSAAIAAAEAGSGVWVVDSGNATIGENILLRYAIRLRDQGLTGSEIAQELERAKSRICLLARVDTLEYLVRGGRLSKTAGVAGTLLNIKPVLSVEDGEIHVLGKARGSRQSENMLTQFIEKKGGIDFSMPVMLAYSGTDDALLKGYIENSRALWEGHLEELPVTMIGSTISTHAGPGAIAVAFFAKG